jgi:EmrB/QacA subfamily drug resistance transporter
MLVTDRARQLATLAITCIGFFMVLLDASIVTVALPTIQRELHTQLAGLQWVVDAYTLPFAVLLLTAGTLGDRFGRKRVFLAGLVIFTAGSALCGLAPSLPLLIAGRALQGVGSAALTPGSLSLLAAAYTVPRERTQALGVWSGISGVALAAGPLVGGLLIQVSGWQAIFFVNLPIGAIALLLGAFLLTESRNPTATHIDIPGQLLAIGGLSALVYALIEGQPDGWSSPTILCLLGAAATLLVLFVIVERRSSDPVLPLGLFKSAVFTTASVAALVVGFALLGTVFFISQFFQELQGYTALQSGTRTLPTTVGIFIVAPLAGRITARFGPRLPIAVGALLAGVALLLLTRLEPGTTYTDLWWNFALFGVGIGLTLSPITAAVLAAVPPQRAGLASGVVTTSRQIGSVLGIAVLGALVESQEAHNLAGSLSRLHLPAALSNGLAGTIASAGAGARQLHLSGRLPISPTELLHLAGQSFAEALHPSFVITAAALFVASVLAYLFLGRGGRITTYSKVDIEPAPAALEPAMKGPVQ